MDFVLFLLISFIVIFCFILVKDYRVRRNKMYSNISSYIVFKITDKNENIDLWLNDISTSISKKLSDIPNKRIIILDFQNDGNTTNLIYKFCYDKGYIYINEPDSLYNSNLLLK